jgi:ATP-dependent Lhr-like helicase
METVFSKLHPKIQEVLLSKEIDLPTEPQIKAINPILNGENVLLIAPTGLGKTESALLPIFHNFLIEKDKQSGKGISILYITPLRALNRDMLRRTFEWAEKLGFSVAVRHGDTSEKERAKQAKSPPDMLITTPETFQILFVGRRLRKHLRTIKWVVVDEIHELASDERGAQLAVGLERLEELKKDNNMPSFQRIGLSATIGNPKEVSRFLGGFENSSFRKVKVIKAYTSKNVEIWVEKPKAKKGDYNDAKLLSIEPDSFATLRRCKELMDQHKSTLLFVNTRDTAEILASRFNLWKKDIPIGIHHGSLSKEIRMEAEDDFKNGKLKSLICTSSLELGIDIGDTDFVIQYNSPRQVTRLIQRVGRSGHKIGKTSKGVIITNNVEDLAESYVIAKKALKNELEEICIRANPLTVLANQVISIAMEYGKIEDKKVFNIIKRAYPFYNLDKKTFDEVLNQLKSQRTVWIENEDKKIFIMKRQKSRHYFLENISMIPDEKSYSVIDIATRRKVGELDESFVLSHGFEGSKFILKGRPWYIVKKEDDVILVTAEKELGTIPSWIGEDIPVPFEVAREVGRLRRLIADGEKQFLQDKVLKDLVSLIERQKKEGLEVPNDKLITIETDGKRSIIINACFGSKVNETLGRVISALLAQQIGESVCISSDPYRISLELPLHIKPEKIREIMYHIKPESLEYLLRAVLKNSTYIRWQLVHTARKFGAITLGFNHHSIGVRKLQFLLENTPIFKETIEKVIWDKMDVRNTKKVLSEIQRNEIDIHIQQISPIALTGYETIKGLMVPPKADTVILKALEKRLEDNDIILFCINCHYSWYTKVERLTIQPKCPKCGAIKLIALKEYEKDQLKVLREGDGKKTKELRKLYKNSSLVLAHGKYAILALMGRGIGPDTASRILSRYNKYDLQKSEKKKLEFLKDILKAELTYARTRGFWNNQ